MASESKQPVGMSTGFLRGFDELGGLSKSELIEELEKRGEEVKGSRLELLKRLIKLIRKAQKAGGKDYKTEEVEG